MLTLGLLRARKAAFAFQSWLAFRAFRLGVGAAVEHTFVLDWSAPATVVDVGANRGQFSLIARLRRPGSQIIAFEPLSEPASVLRSLFREDDHFALHRLALGDREEELEMRVTVDDDSSSLLPIGKLQEQIFDTTQRGTEKVGVRRLDTVTDGAEFQRPVLLKIDVQGFELSVLKGALETLEFIDFILVESSFIALYDNQALASDVIQFLSGHGFKLRGSFNQFQTRTAGPVQSDLLFSRV